MKIVFMGTPDFAVPSLNTLIASAHEVAGVVTQPDRPRGRGQKPCPTAVKSAALACGLPVLQPESLKNPDFLNQLSAWQADCFAVVAFRILPPVVFEMPAKGTINLHGSLLPKYRGAAPIQWAIWNGDSETGVTTFFIEKSIDTGQWLMQRKIPIQPEDTTGTLHDKMSLIGADLLLHTLDGIQAGTLQAKPQTGDPCGAPKIFPDQGEINWKQPAEAIHRQIRAFSPSPGAYSTWRGKRIKIYASRIEEANPDDTLTPGTVLTDGQTLRVRTGSKNLVLLELQMQGKKRLPAADFLRGVRFHTGDVFG